MRQATLAALVLVGFASTAVAEYEETRELSVDASGADELILKTGAGSLQVEGVDGLDTVEVEAQIVIDVMRDSKGREIAEKGVLLELDRNGDTVRLEADIDQGLWNFGSGGQVNLVVRAPTGLEILIDDGSGSIAVKGTKANVRIDDGSGSIKVAGVADLTIDDGSGSITVDDAQGDVSIIDGSGSITVQNVGGSVTIDDGSGSIRVSDVEEDLIIVDDGSGSLKFDDVRGTVEQDG